MAFTGYIFYLNGAIALDSYGFQLEGDIDTSYGSHSGLLSVKERSDGTMPSSEFIRVHVYRDGLLLHVMKPCGTWYHPSEEYEGEKRWPGRLLLKLEE
jgi:hypothetical protein